MEREVEQKGAGAVLEEGKRFCFYCKGPELVQRKHGGGEASDKPYAHRKCDRANKRFQAKLRTDGLRREREELERRKKDFDEKIIPWLRTHDSCANVLQTANALSLKSLYGIDLRECLKLAGPFEYSVNDSMALALDLSRKLVGRSTGEVAAILSLINALCLPIERMVLRHNELSALPDAIDGFGELETIDAAHNNIVSLQVDSIKAMPKLYLAVLNFNRVDEGKARKVIGEVQAYRRSKNSRLEFVVENSFKEPDYVSTYNTIMDSYNMGW